MYGWDWGARLPDAGIWREVSLLFVEKARIDNVSITQKHKEGKVTLSFQTDVEVLEKERLYRLQGNDKDEKILREEGYPCRISVTAPNGSGEQPLYRIRLALYKDDELLDVWDEKIGLRTVTVIREKDQWGEGFCHEVNGVRIFAMGADYIPENHIPPKMTPERTYDLLLQAKNAKFNCVRVWGGGHYPYDAFWDACDELGLLVWQDFMFACCVYDLTEEFEDSIKAEFIDNIKRIRHHASLGLWCGNNEMELFLEENPAGWCCKERNAMLSIQQRYQASGWSG